MAFSGLSVFTFYLSLVWTIVTTTRRVQRAQEATGLSHRLNGWISAALWIFTLSIGGIVYTQSELNKAWKTQAVEGRDPELGADDHVRALDQPLGELHIEDPEEWPAEHPALWDPVSRRAYKKRYGKLPGA